MEYKDHEYKQGIKDCIITENSVQMTFCKTCKTCPAVNITKDSDTVIVGGDDEGYTKFTKGQFELFIEECKAGTFDKFYDESIQKTFC
jgi:hypothetical protein